MSFLPRRLLDRPLSSFPSLWNLLEENFPSTESENSGIRIFEKNNQLHVEVPMPGIDDPKGIDVELNEGNLFIRGGTEKEERDDEKKIYRYGMRRYQHTIPLPKRVEAKDAVANYEDGILKIAFKLSKEEDKKKITVQSGKKANVQNGKKENIQIGKK